MVQWVFVSYPRMRDVFIDGQRSGPTNEPLATFEGEQEISLGLPRDYRPRRRVVVVTGTTSSTPTLIEFNLEP